MRYILALSVLLALFDNLNAQYVYTIKADSVKITNCDSAELILENHTQGVPGFLFNTGNGRTIFKRGAQKLNDSTYLIGADTIKVSSNPWVQGGNAFGTIGVLGTRDNNPLDLYTNNVDQARLTTNGDLLLGSTTDSSYKLDAKGPARFGAYLGQNMVRGSLNFDNGANAAYIMQSNSLLRSLQIPGTGGSAPWVFNNTANEGIEVVDVAGTVFVAGGKINITSTNFTNVGSIIATEPSAYNNRTIYIGNTALNHANENGTNVQIVGGSGGTLPAVYNGGNIIINAGLQGAKGANGNILLGNLVNGNVGIQTSAPNSNFEVDQGTQGSGVVITAAGGTTVTGISTQFTNTFKVGDSITIAGQTVAITAIASDVSMTTTPTAQDSNVTYTLTGGRRFVVKGNGMVGVGVSAPTSQLDVLAPSGYSQFRLRTSYTPTSSTDPNGNVGDFSWDANYMYVKTASGWKRTSLGTF